MTLAAHVGRRKVALRKESVDRNLCALLLLALLCVVALRKESVDRNAITETIEVEKLVALRKESVDRNMRLDVSYNIKETSLSARRAWIEMSIITA